MANTNKQELKGKHNDSNWVNVHVSLMMAVKMRKEKCNYNSRRQSTHCVGGNISTKCVMTTQQTTESHIDDSCAISNESWICDEITAPIIPMEMYVAHEYDSVPLTYISSLLFYTDSLKI